VHLRPGFFRLCGRPGQPALRTVTRPTALVSWSWTSPPLSWQASRFPAAADGGRQLVSVLRGSGVTTPGPWAVVCPGEASQGERTDQEPEVSQGDVVEARVRQQVNDDAREP
jgi:hypothetical protein